MIFRKIAHPHFIAFARRNINSIVFRRFDNITIRSFHTSFPVLAIKPFLLADIGEGIAEVELMQWFVKPGDKVKEFDLICEVQSDKATVEITSRFSGVVKSLNCNIGDMIAVGKALVDIEIPDDSVTSEIEKPTTSNKQEPMKNVEVSNIQSYDIERKGPIKATPAVRRIARENNLNLASVTPTGPEGRVLKSDILNYLQLLTQPQAVVSVPSQLSLSSVTEEKQFEQKMVKPQASYTPTAGEIVPIRGIRRLMVKSMNESLSIPHFGYQDEVDITELTTLRNLLRTEAEARGFKLSYLPIFIKAASLALSKYPVLNSSLSSDQTQLTYHADHNIGVAMDTPRGLIVPSIKQCQKKSILEIAQELTSLQQLGTADKLGEEHLKGTTFTLSNIGTIGGTYMSPVITSPQVAIGAIGKIQKLPRFDKNDNVVAAQIMQISWSGDHRVIDGATMARFSNQWKQYLENPLLLIGDLK